MTTEGEKIDKLKDVIIEIIGKYDRNEDMKESIDNAHKTLMQIYGIKEWKRWRKMQSMVR